MIVADSNVIAYCWLKTPMTSVAQQVRTADPDWHVPLLWRSELRSALAGYLRAGQLSGAHVRQRMREVERELHGSEHLVSSDAVIRVVEASGLSAYDAEFVALAEELGVVLVTEDKMVLKTFPSLAVSMERFLGHGQ